MTVNWETVQLSHVRNKVQRQPFQSIRKENICIPCVDLNYLHHDVLRLLEIKEHERKERGGIWVEKG